MLGVWNRRWTINNKCMRFSLMIDFKLFLLVAKSPHEHVSGDALFMLHIAVIRPIKRGRFIVFARGHQNQLFIKSELLCSTILPGRCYIKKVNIVWYDVMFHVVVKAGTWQKRFIHIKINCSASPLSCSTGQIHRRKPKQLNQLKPHLRQRHYWGHYQEGGREVWWWWRIKQDLINSFIH